MFASAAQRSRSWPESFAASRARRAQRSARDAEPIVDSAADLLSHSNPVNHALLFLSVILKPAST
jgi:hypothetical protein